MLLRGVGLGLGLRVADLRFVDEFARERAILEQLLTAVEQLLRGVERLARRLDVALCPGHLLGHPAAAVDR